MKYVYVKTPSVEALGAVSSTLPENIHHNLGVLVTLLWSFNQLSYGKYDVRWFSPVDVHQLVAL